jgi:DNA-binding transcriptional MerR regulator
MREAAERTLTIGAFARRARLSPKALRLYDRLGILSPAAVDEHNGYRRYRESQLATVSRRTRRSSAGCSRTARR